MIEPKQKAEYAEFLRTDEGKNILLLAGFGQRENIMTNNLLNLMADVLHPDRQDEIYFHPNSMMKEIDLTQSTPAALQGACKDIHFNLSEILDSKEMTKVKRIKG